MSKDNVTTPSQKIPAGSLTLTVAGDIILPKCDDKNMLSLFRRYQALFELVANLPKEDRIIKYKFINALMLTSHAKKSLDTVQKKHLFDLKNSISINIINDSDLRHKISLKYLTSKNFLVTTFCQDCLTKNQTLNLPKHKWTFCPKCAVDKNYYNVLSLQHKFNDGSFVIFLSNDQLAKLKNASLKNKDLLKNHKEEGRVLKYRYDVSNLNAFSLESVLKMYDFTSKVK